MRYGREPTTEIDELIGTYAVLDFKNSNLARRYELVLGSGAGAEVGFTLKSILSGPWGSRGTEWHGIARLDGDRLHLGSETVTDWSFTVVEDERSDRMRGCIDPFTLQVMGGGSLGLALTIDGHDVLLVKKGERGSPPR